MNSTETNVHPGADGPCGGLWQARSMADAVGSCHLGDDDGVGKGSAAHRSSE